MEQSQRVAAYRLGYNSAVEGRLPHPQGVLWALLGVEPVEHHPQLAIAYLRGRTDGASTTLVKQVEISS